MTTNNVMNNYMNTENVYVAKSSLGGLGVFAKNDIKKGDLVEKSMVMPLKNIDGNENPHLFTWSNDKTVWAAGAGYLPFYNHSDTPNIIKKAELDKNILDVFALKDIQKGDELCNTYMSKPWRKCFESF